MAGGMHLAARWIGEGRGTKGLGRARIAGELSVGGMRSSLWTHLTDLRM